MARHGHPTDADQPPTPPGPDGLPFLGSTLRLVRAPFDFIDEVARHGDVVSYSLAGIEFCAILHPDQIERVLVGEPERFRRWTGEEWNVLGEFAPEGLLLTEGEQWRRQRRLIQPAFTPDRLASQAAGMVEATERTVDRWMSGETIALNREASRLTLAILARSLFDLDVSGRDDTVTRAARAINDRADSRSLGTFLPSWVPTPARRRSRRAMAALDGLLDDLITERRMNPGVHDDLLARLLDAGDDGAALSEAEVRDNLVTFLFAGHETSSLALTYALVLLARHPESLARLRAEIDTVLGEAPPTPEVLPELVYTEQVITEALRLYPPVYVLFREATEDVTLGGYAIPEGTKLSLPVYNIHRDPRWYDDPDTFRPERWADDGDDGRPEYAYFPFGGGPRHCIGMRFAMLELQHVLPTVVRQVDLDPLDDGDIAFQPGVTLQPAETVEVRVRRR